MQTAGPLLTHYAPIFPILSADGTSMFAPMQTDAEAVASVRALAEAGADAIKVWYLNPPSGQAEALDARLLLIGQEAEAQGLPLVVHATELRNAKAALRAGAAMLVHSVEDASVDDEFIALMREAGTVYAPTLRVGRNWRRARARAEAAQHSSWLASRPSHGKTDIPMEGRSGWPREASIRTAASRPRAESRSAQALRPRADRFGHLVGLSK